MLYFLCIVMPPLAVLLTGRPVALLLNLLLTLLGWLPGVIHAFFVVAEAKADRREKRMIEEVRRERATSVFLRPPGR